MNKNQLEAFSDGVIAIIITIMVLELKVPRDTSLNAIAALWPTFFSYALSFIFIGIYWGNHHHLLHVVKKVSSGIIWANLNLLFWLSLIPFATGWMGQNHFAKYTVVAYAVLLNICGIAYTILQRLIASCHHYTPAMQAAMDKQTQKGVISMVGYSAALGLAFVHPLISEILFVSVAILWLVPDKNIERAYSGE
jgi:uncharacterized membrane protein